MIETTQQPDLLETLKALSASVSQMSSMVSHVIVGGASAHVIEWAKSKPLLAKIWLLLSARQKVLVTALCALVSSLGLTITFHHNEPGVYGLVVSGLTSAHVGQHVWSFAQSWLSQQGWFMMIIQPRPVTGAQRGPTIDGHKSPAPVPVPVVTTVPGGQS